jgi:ADP-heptose:LPS heptosyltransferase
MLLYYRRTYMVLSHCLAIILWLPLRIANKLLNPGRRTASPPKKILIQDGYFLGDLLLLSHALKSIRAAFPESQVHLLAQPAGCELLRNSGWIDKFITFSPPWSFKQPLCGAIRAVLSCIRTLRIEHYDLAIDFHGEVRGLALLFFCTIPFRISFSDFGGRPWCTASYATPKHAVQQMKRSMYLVQRITGRDAGTSDFPLWPLFTKSDVPTEQQKTAGGGDAGRGGIILIHPATANPDKQWPAACFTELIDMLDIQQSPSITLVGGKEDKTILDAIIAGVKRPCRIVYPTFAELEQLLRKARLLVCLDSFCQHAASSLGTPVVGIYGPSKPYYSAPQAGPISIVWNDRILRPPYAGYDGPRSMAASTARTVFSAINESLE